jgi:tryptophanyl-tRNA synthetase
MKIIDPWGESLVKDYKKVVEQFGLEKFDANEFPEPNRLMRRGMVFAGRDLKQISKCIKEGKSFYVLSGIMPSNDKIHFGNKMVIENIKYFQEHGGHAYVLVADLESAATRGVSLEEARKRAMEFHIPAYIALGLDPKKTTFYFQSENIEVSRLAALFSKKVTANEFKAIYGSIDPGRVIGSLMQCGDMVYPQTIDRMPGIIPIGPDQDPHVRLCRDLIRRFKDKKFFQLSSVYHKFTPALNGELKMSKSHPESNIDLPADPALICKKIKRSVSGGRETLEEHRKKGGNVSKDMAYMLLEYHLLEDDAELERIKTEYESGRMTSGEIKKIACDQITIFLEDFNKKLEKAKKNVSKLNFIK